MKTELDFLTNNAKQNFGILKKWTNNISGNDAYENILNLLTHAIAKLLDTDYHQLIDILYKNDIDESKVKQCFDAEKTNREVAKEIAKLYLIRLQAKWKTRQEFNNKDIVGDWD